MRKMFTLAAILAASISAHAEPSATVTPGQWKWEQGRSYRTPSGVGAYVYGRIKNMATGQYDLVVEVIETVPAQRETWPHGMKFIVTDWASLGEFRPAYLCFTQPRGYGNLDGSNATIEVDRYTQYSPCPIVPID